MFRFDLRRKSGIHFFYPAGSQAVERKVQKKAATACPPATRHSPQSRVRHGLAAPTSPPSQPDSPRMKPSRSASYRHAPVHNRKMEIHSSFIQKSDTKTAQFHHCVYQYPDTSEDQARLLQNHNFYKICTHSRYCFASPA